MSRFLLSLSLPPLCVCFSIMKWAAPTHFYLNQSLIVYVLVSVLFPLRSTSGSSFSHLITSACVHVDCFFLIFLFCFCTGVFVYFCVWFILLL